MSGQFDILQIQAILREFAIARDWETFHTPKNLAMALSEEASELLEIFQWLTPVQSIEVGCTAAAVGEELTHELQSAVRQFTGDLDRPTESTA